MIESLIDRLTRASIRFKWVTIVLTILVLAAGVVAALQLNQELLPRIEFPQSVILALNPGTEVDVMLEEVTLPLEEAWSTWNLPRQRAFLF
jgi:HAE1 family hydrophobic/amphiphilic exporter-1